MSDTRQKELRQKLLATFQVEHRDHVEQIRVLLSSIEGAPGPELEEALRRAHSLKGAARAVDLHSVEMLSHRLETLFSRVRQGELRFDGEVARAVGQALDASDDCVASLGGSRPAPDVASALAALSLAMGAEPGPVPEVSPAPAAKPDFQPIETIRIAVGSFDSLFRSAGVLLAESRRQSGMTARTGDLAGALKAIEKQAAGARRAAAARDYASLSETLDSLERQAGALARQSAAAVRAQKHGLWRMRHLGDRLERDIWLARMAPASNLIDGFRQMMRDLARDQQKEIEFHAAATGALADRQVLDALKDPLLHVLRNAVSHGIESPRERIAKGKPAAGIVRMQVGSEGQRLIVTVEDDGRGVDFARVAEVAARDGILPADAGNDLTRILFRPGFTTSRTVTNLSGRGMGLSVVQESVRRLRGDVRIAPRPGAGTRVHFSVPLSIATHRLLIVQCGDQIFAIPIHNVERLYRLDLESVKTVEGRPMIALEGRTMPVYSLARLLDLEGVPAPACGNLLVLRTADAAAAVIVDSLLNEFDTVIHDLGPASPASGRISGAVLLEDERIAFVLSVAELLASPEHVQLPAPPPAEAESPRAPEAVSILVVDDSMTTRTLEKSILEAHGYRVRVAVDGMEGLTRLREEKPDLVISDVQMPKLDGFGMVEEMKKDPRLAQVPVIIVSSLERREDRERGLGLGADAYIVKRRFDQGELLAAIRQIVR